MVGLFYPILPLLLRLVALAWDPPRASSPLQPHFRGLCLLSGRPRRSETSSPSGPTPVM